MITVEQLPDGRWEVKGPDRSYGKYRNEFLARWRARVVRVSQRPRRAA